MGLSSLRSCFYLKRGRRCALLRANRLETSMNPAVRLGAGLDWSNHSLSGLSRDISSNCRLSLVCRSKEMTLLAVIFLVVWSPRHSSHLPDAGGSPGAFRRRLSSSRSCA